MRLRVYRSLKFYMFQRISNENWNLISRSSVVLKINPRGFENWRGITRTELSWNAIIDWTCRRGFYGAWCIKGWKSDYRPVRYRNGSIVRPVSLSKWAQQLTFPRLCHNFSRVSSLVVRRIELAKTKNWYTRWKEQCSNVENQRLPTRWIWNINNEWIMSKIEIGCLKLTFRDGRSDTGAISPISIRLWIAKRVPCCWHSWFSGQFREDNVQTRGRIHWIVNIFATPLCTIIPQLRPISITTGDHVQVLGYYVTTHRRVAY